MTFQQLEYFMALAERLSFTQTANDLYMAQTTLSRSISTLEQELGMTLFRRTSRTVELTPAGRAFRDGCAPLLESYKRALDAAHLAEQGLKGELTIGILQDNFDDGAVEIYRAMRHSYPEINLRFVENNHSQLMSGLHRGETDAILNSGSAALTDEEDSILLSESHQCAVIPADWPLAQRESVAVRELKDLPFVVMSQSASQPGRAFLWQSAVNAGFIPHVAAEANHVPSLLMLVACGTGLTFLMDTVQNPCPERIKYVPIADAPPSRQSLVWLRENENPSLPRLIEVTRKISEEQAE